MDGDGIFAAELEEFVRDVKGAFEGSQAKSAILVAGRSRVIAGHGVRGGPGSLDELMREFVRREQDLDALVKGVEETGVATHANEELRRFLRFELLQRRMIVGLGGSTPNLFAFRVRQIEASLRHLLARLEEKAQEAGGVAVPFAEMKAEDVRAAFGR